MLYLEIALALAIAPELHAKAFGFALLAAPAMVICGALTALADFLAR